MGGNMSDIFDEARYQSENAQGVLPRSRWKDAADEIERLRARIEELKANRFDLLDRLSALTGEADLVFIPNERIDKAVEWIGGLHVEREADELYAAHKVIYFLGIVDDGEGGWRMKYE
jgi:hypothetical protein